MRCPSKFHYTQFIAVTYYYNGNLLHAWLDICVSSIAIRDSRNNSAAKSHQIIKHIFRFFPATKYVVNCDVIVFTFDYIVQTLKEQNKLDQLLLHC